MEKEEKDTIVSYALSSPGKGKNTDFSENLPIPGGVGFRCEYATLYKPSPEDSNMSQV